MNNNNKKLMWKKEHSNEIKAQEWNRKKSTFKKLGHINAATCLFYQNAKLQPSLLNSNAKK